MRGNISNESSAIVQRLWNYWDVLRDDGVSYGDYVEQLTYLLFLKMVDEQTKPHFNKPSIILELYTWPEMQKRDGGELVNQYRETMVALGSSKGLLGIILRKAQNRIQDPAKLIRSITFIDEETWMGLDIDIKGEIYEGLLQKDAEDIKGRAGQI